MGDPLPPRHPPVNGDGSSPVVVSRVPLEPADTQSAEL